MRGLKNHPYIPNSNPEIQKEMLDYLGLKDLDELHAEIPDEIILDGPLDLPEPIISEYELKRHLEDILAKNRNCEENINFLGAGCWQHYVPAVCDEINRRGEFLTGYAGEVYNDLGRFQTLFEYQSMIGELVNMDVCNVPTMDWGQAAATSVRMSSRITGRKTCLMPKTVGPQRLKIIQNYTKPDMNIVLIDIDEETGLMDLEDLKAHMNDDVASVYIENPTYLGFLETQGQEIADMIHANGGVFVVGVDPISLGVLEAPASYGADIVCGDLQPLGMHIQYGGGQAGFIATRDEEKYVMEIPSRIFGITKTIKDGEYGFGDVAYVRTSFGDLRDGAKEYVGTQTALWGITAGVYLSLMGPEGMRELGQNIIQSNLYAIKELNEIDGVKASRFSSQGFKEFVVDFNGTGKTVKEINKALLDHNIFGGKDLSEEFPELGQSALYCVTEVHLQSDIDKLVTALTEILKGA